MTTTIITALTLLALLGAMYIISRSADINRRQSIEIKTLRWEVNRHNEADRDTNARYVMNRPESEQVTTGASSSWAVYRISDQGDRKLSCCIKVFADEDEAYNFNEAEELLDKLNAQ